MQNRRPRRSVLGFALLLLALGPARAASPAPDEVQAAIGALRTLAPEGPQECCAVIDDHLAATRGDAPARAAIEAQLAAVLGPESTRAAKEYACRKLAVFGTETSVPAAAALLADPELAHMARWVLERIPGNAAGAAMRKALPDTSAATRIGILHSLGMRRDREAVPAVAAWLGDADVAVATAAAGALGEIGTEEAAEALLKHLDSGNAALSDATRDALLRAGQHLLAENRKTAATTLYRRLYQAGEPTRIRAAALRGLLRADDAAAPGLALDALRGTDPALRQAAAEFLARDASSAVVQALTAPLAELPGDTRTGLIEALSLRPDNAAREAVDAALRSDAAEVRAAALRALAAVGTEEDLPVLIRAAASGEQTEKDAARAALARMKGAALDARLEAELARADAATRIELARALGARYAADQVPTLLEYTADPDANVRRAAFEAVAQAADGRHTAGLVRALCGTTSPADRGAAEKALAALEQRLGTECAEPIVQAIDGANPEAQCALVRALAKAQCTPALEALLRATASPNADLRADAVRALSEWNTHEAGPRLFELAGTGEDPKLGLLALRGFIQVTGRSKLGGDAKLAGLRQAWALAQRPEEKKLILGEGGRIGALAAMAFALNALDDPSLGEEAAAAAVASAAASRVTPPEAPTVVAAMDKILAAAQNQKTLDAARKVRDTYAK
ncbi:MAG: HEAT repeat domain-containing protein [Lentisphaeria bacterium]|nr:HEAT repeat domain-containing protein [Lentisphaeria bacterium]